VAKRVTKGNLWGFIQSRPYASVADIRRLFSMEVEGAAPIPTSEGTCYIGLPSEVADIIRQLWHEGRVGLDLNVNVKARVVQGVFPARLPMHRSGASSGESSAEGESGRRKRKRGRRLGGAAGDDVETAHPARSASPAGIVGVAAAAAESAAAD
jgi:hypothetical protein